ncbi:hypothetical protein FF011L_30330 [Roseimaritima multifibrata]|uniref:Uncharacterized protein n=1 Tax=Roseimaritima multifibrata TaxID=1930274 RepID=A0A517MH96_9BACT|nr:hypothetical protein FF011L_30330 [Roseimaritima multifibrata]
MVAQSWRGMLLDRCGLDFDRLLLTMLLGFLPVGHEGSQVIGR